jgi:transposase
MDASDLRKEIERALRAVWPRFAAEYPLATMRLDRERVLEAAADHFAEDADYQDALADASARQVPEQEMTLLIRKLVRDWLLRFMSGPEEC